MGVSLESVVMALVVDAGSARSLAMEALRKAQESEFEQANSLLAQCEETLEKAHEYQTDLIQREASGENIPMSMLLVHAQDHLMNAGLIHNLAEIIVDLYSRLESGK